MPGGESLRLVLERSWRGRRASASASTTPCWWSPCAVNRVILCKVLGLPISRLWTFRQAPTTLNLLEGADLDSLEVVRLNDCATTRRSSAKPSTAHSDPSLASTASAGTAAVTNTPTTLADWLDYRQHPATIDMGLERVRAVATAMGLGRRPSAPSWSVAPTARAPRGLHRSHRACCRLEGRRVHLAAPAALHERVRIDGHDVEDAALVAAFNTIEAARGDITLTYFEYGTLAALQLFADAGLDLAVLEVGLGGRLDAVNIVDADVAVITTVDIDHAEWLGGDREAIGTERPASSVAGSR